MENRPGLVAPGPSEPVPTPPLCHGMLWALHAVPCVWQAGVEGHWGTQVCTRRQGCVTMWLCPLQHIPMHTEFMNTRILEGYKIPFLF